MRPQYRRKASHKPIYRRKRNGCRNPLPVPRFTARGNKYSHRGTAPACPWVPRVAVVQCPLRRPGASCLSLSSRAVGKAPSGTGTRGSQGWRPAFIRPYMEACISCCTMPSAIHKSASSATVLFPSLFPFPKKRQKREIKCTHRRKKGWAFYFHFPDSLKKRGIRTASRKRGSPVFTVSAGTSRKTLFPFFMHRQKGK